MGKIYQNQLISTIKTITVVNRLFDAKCSVLEIMRITSGVQVSRATIASAGVDLYMQSDVAIFLL
jgi:hypothetical protein